MKHIITLVLLLFFCISGAISQITVELEKGDKAYDELALDEALYFFEIANEQQPDNPDITRRIANTYRRMGQMTISAEWYEKAIETGSTNSLDILYYAEALKSLQQYDEAMVWYEKYAALVPGDSRAKNHLRAPNYYVDLLADTLKYEMKSLLINNSDPVIGITAFENNSFLLSAIDGEMKKKEDKKNESLSYLDIYKVDLSTEDELINPVRLGEAVNSIYHEGPASYCTSNKTLYITRNNINDGKPVLDKNGSINLKIYQAEFVNGAWTEAQTLKFNNDDYSNGHPCVSNDGMMMYFVSNRPGGIGGTDIYVSERAGDTWTEPLNLGATINTEGNEMFPFISEDGRLYFSSDGHAGLGGLDIFYTRMQNGQWQNPSNLGAPINSASDDFSLWYRKSDDKGFFCSNRSGRGNDDIFFYHHIPLRKTIIDGTIKSIYPEISLVGERIKILSTNSKLASEQRLSEKSAFRFYAEPGDEIEVFMMDTDYFDTSEPVFKSRINDPLLDPYIYVGDFIVGLKFHPAEGGQLAVLKERGISPAYSALKETMDNPVEIARVKDDVAAVVVNSKEKGKINEKVGKSGPESFKNSTSIIDLAELNVDRIQFDFNKANIRESDFIKLDQLVQLMENNSGTKLMIKAYCDSRGGRTYNENLSMARAMAVKGYLIQKGINRKRLRTEWFGEDKPLNDCNDGIPCSEEEYGLNRRAEFKLIAIKK